MSAHQPIRLLLEIEPGADPLQGRIRGEAGALGFTGWTELGQSIVRLAGPAIDHRNPEEQP